MGGRQIVDKSPLLYTIHTTVQHNISTACLEYPTALVENFFRVTTAKYVKPFFSNYLLNILTLGYICERNTHNLISVYNTYLPTYVDVYSTTFGTSIVQEGSDKSINNMSNRKDRG